MIHPTAAFAELVDRAPFDLSPDESESLEFHFALTSLIEGRPAHSALQRWCLMAQNVQRLTHMLGRLPKGGAPGTSSEILAWIDGQRQPRLNSFQRAADLRSGTDYRPSTGYLRGAQWSCGPPPRVRGRARV